MNSSSPKWAPFGQKNTAVVAAVCSQNDQTRILMNVFSMEPINQLRNGFAKGTTTNKTSTLIKHNPPLKLRQTGKVHLTRLHESSDQVTPMVAAALLLVLMAGFVLLTDYAPGIFDGLHQVLVGGL
jgi:hypothetical protein